MKIRLLKNGGYLGFDAVAFPVEVEARPQGSGWEVSNDELKRIGCDMTRFGSDYPWWAFCREHVEVMI